MGTVKNISALKTELKMMGRFLSNRYLSERPYRPAAEHYSYGTVDRAHIINAQSILLLGSNDLVPCKQAADLYRLISRYVPGVSVVASGLGGHRTVPGPVFKDASGNIVPEAVRYRQELLSLGVPESSILVDPESTSTGGNIVNSYRLLSSSGMFPKRFAIVQTPLAQLRAGLTFERQWAGEEWDYYFCFSPDIQSYFRSKDLSDGAAAFYHAYSLRELSTIMGYATDPSLPYITERFVPDRDIPVEILQIIFDHMEQNKSARQMPNGYFSSFDNIRAAFSLFRDKFKAVNDRLFLNSE